MNSSQPSSVVPDTLIPALHTLACHYHDSVTAVLWMVHHQNNTWSVKVLWWSLFNSYYYCPAKCTLSVGVPDDKGEKYFSNCTSLLYLSIILPYFYFVYYWNWLRLPNFISKKKTSFLLLTFLFILITNHEGFFFSSSQWPYAIYQWNGPVIASNHFSFKHQINVEKTIKNSAS